MLIKRIEMTNFRQFQGKQAFDFAIDPVKNITVIMGENGAGKTTLAQAFLWALYGENDFQNKELLNRDVKNQLKPNDIANVAVKIFVSHNGQDYIIWTQQKYRREATATKSENIEMRVVTKVNGQTDEKSGYDAKKMIQSMMPKELSKFFFFDGERIKTMSDEIAKGKSKQFADAVTGLVGLTAMMNAINHLKPSTTNNTVIGRYNNKIDETGNAKIQEYSQRIKRIEIEKEELERRASEIEPQITYYQEEVARIKHEILSHADAIEVRARYNALEAEVKRLQVVKKEVVREFLSYFNKNAHAFLAKPIIKDSLAQLASAEKLDKGIPDMHQKTIEFLLTRGACICGNKLTPGSDAVKELYKLIDYLPPKSIGTMIGQFAQVSREKNRQGDSFFSAFANFFKRIREVEDSVTSKTNAMTELYNSLTDTTGVKLLREKQAEYTHRISQFSGELKNKIEKIGAVKKDKDYLEAQKDKLILVDEKNREINTYRQYAIEIYNMILENYEYQKMVTREKLERYINEIFVNIYEGGIEIKVDDKYNITVSVSETGQKGEDLERSTAQNYSVIFAFIAGIIKMAKEKSKDVNASEKEVSADDLIFQDALGYPLVMDAPLSAFDKKRIQNICNTLPKIAQQVVFFIKDTDGEVAEAHLADLIGSKHLVKKHSLTYSEICPR